MNATSYAIFGFACFVMGIMFGAVMVAMSRDAHDGIKDKRHEDTVVEQGKEIARLRAQVALHINEEK